MTAPSTDPLAATYVRLAHGLDAHVKQQGGYFIDGYGGPAEWADHSLRRLETLQQEAQQLDALIAAEPDPQRRPFLEAQARAMHTTLQLLAGERLPYSEEVRRLFDIEPLRVPEATFEAALAQLDAALPGSGALTGRSEQLRQRVALPHGDILRMSAPILETLRRRTRQLLPLPDDEDFSIGLVSNQPWSGYNWPLGNFRSRIDINTDLPVLLPSLPDLLAHEGYPGHHTEHALKELHLARERGWAEHTLQLISAPECVVSEGIAVNALHAVMPEQEVEGWLTGELSREAGLDPSDVAAWLHSARASEQLSGVGGNAAWLLHQEGRPEAEVLEYLMTYSASTEERARQTLRFISSPAGRAYVYTYSVGGRLVREAMQAGDPQAVFRQLLTRPVTPGQLAAGL
ncbi:hypothetical protein [Deinococcus sonorensis]|uniref:DUF885 domain-containing protein n=2 Tax=Deinococcus sonorensis TaxID=309891 RepID=A0AAU7UEU6_9DEIO